MKHFLYGAPLALSIPPTESEGGPWTEICYEVELKGYRRADGSYARITADDIASMVANFERYPKAPIVVEHADTRIEAAEVNPDWAEPHGWIVALRQGKRTRTVAGKTVTVATLEGRLDVSPEMRLAIVGDSAAGVPPTWPFCSVTTARGVDDETGADLGTVLHSVSLTAHPRLADLPRLAAARSTPPMNPRRRGAAAPATTAVAEQPAAPAQSTELGYWYGDLDSREDVLSMLRAVLDLPVVTDEAAVLADLTKLEGMVGGGDAAGVDVDDIVCRLRDAMRLPALSTAAEVIASVRKGLTELPSEMMAETQTQLSRGRQTAATTSDMEKTTMKKFMEMAVELKLPAVATEDAAEAAVLALARDGAAVRTALSLTADVPVTSRLAELVTAGAELPRVREELATLKASVKERETAEAKAAAERAEAELVRRVDEVCLAKGWDDDVKPALLAFGRSDRTAFDAKHPAPSVAELAQRAQDSERTQVVARGTGGSDKGKVVAEKTELAQQIASLQGAYSRAGYELSVAEAIDHIQRGETADEAARTLGLTAG